MLFRINQKNLLLYMIDYFTREELLSLQYLAIGVGLVVRGGMKNVSRSANDIYPSVECITNYNDSPELFRKSFCSELSMNREHVYRNVIEPIVVAKQNLVLVCIDTQDNYLDIFLEWLKKNYRLDCVDLNKLFTEGETEVFSIDIGMIKKLSEDVRKHNVANIRRFKEATLGGRRKLIREELTRKEKIQILREHGVSVDKSDLPNLNELLEEIWVNQYE